MQPWLLKIGKILSVCAACFAALAASVLVAGYAVMFSADWARGTPAYVIFAAIGLPIFSLFGFIFLRMSWPFRAALAILLVAICFSLLPRPSCAAEPQASSDC